MLGECVKTTVLIVCSSGTVATIATKVFFFLQSFVCTFKKNIFIKTRIYIVILTQQISQYFTIIEVLISYKSK